MEFQGFAGEVLLKVRKKEEAFQGACIVTNRKNNGVEATGITIKGGGVKTAPCIYLADYYEAYRKGEMDTDAAAGAVCRSLMEHSGDMDAIDAGSFPKWKWVKSRIHLKLVNREMNREMLKGMPSRGFLDLAAVFYVKPGTLPDGSIASIMVQDSHMEMWKRDVESLYRTALSNMRADGEPLFCGMGEVLRGILSEEASFAGPDGGEPSGEKMYVLTNRDKVFGAAEILDGSTLKGIADKLSDDFLVLPSSVHETIIVPSGGISDCREMAGIVREINRTQVAREEWLSDHVYLYSREEGKLKIAA